MTTREILIWIDTNLKSIIEKAIQDSKIKNPALLYTTDWLTAMAYRETGRLIEKRILQGFKVPAIWEQMMGDYSTRPGETQPSHHGFGIWQMDIGSYPDFIKAGDWKDPYKTCKMAISVLEGKRLWLQRNYPTVTGEQLNKAITAAYNCGEGNEGKCLKYNKEIDAYTTEHNYSTDVWRLRSIYLDIIKTKK
jgi:hypothetical protein